MTLFFSTLNQLAYLFAFIAIGFLVAKCGVVSDKAAGVLSKLENFIFVPALVLETFIKNFTVEQLSSTWKTLLISLAILIVVIPLVMLISRLITKSRYERNIFTYALAFSNFGFMGNAVVAALFPDIFLTYIIFTLPLWMAIYLWGAPTLLIADEGKQGIKSRLKAFVNPMFIAIIIGIVIGLCAIPVPDFAMSVISTSSSCMSPIAMLLTGITLSRISFKKTFTNLRIYAVSLVRLIVLPLLFLLVARFLPLDRSIFLCALCTLAMPLGLNTIVIPSAYGKDTTVAAGMALISHMLSCITIPLIFLLI